MTCRRDRPARPVATNLPGGEVESAAQPAVQRRRRPNRHDPSTSVASPNIHQRAGQCWLFPSAAIQQAIAAVGSIDDAKLAAYLASHVFKTVIGGVAFS